MGKSLSQKSPRIIFLDIETSPNLGYVWGKWEQDVIEFAREWNLLSFAYKVRGERKVHVHALPDFKGTYKNDKFDDSHLAWKLFGVLDQADIVIAHNGDAFDIPKINARMIAAGITPPSPFRTIDTYKIAKNRFGFTSNKLNDLGVTLGVGTKAETGGFATWRGCMEGNMESWRIMKKYNAQDVLLLERVYEKLGPWAKTLPNINAYTEENGCPFCSDHDVQKRGFERTQMGKKQRYHCQKCGRWSYGPITRITGLEIR